MTVYVGDNMHGALMIKHVGGQWQVFRLKEVQVKYSSYSTIHPKYKSLKWIWEKTPFARHGYKPYDDDDVVHSPNSLISHVRRMANYKLRVMVS